MVNLRRDDMFYGINLEEIQGNMIRAVSLNMDLGYRLERSGLEEETKILRMQTQSCLQTLAYIQNALEVQRYDSGDIAPCPFNISDKTAEIAAMVRSKTRRYRISFESEIEKGITCFADPERYAACLVNLIVNAFQNVDCDEGEIRVTLKKLGDYAVATVVDNGYGMSQSDLEQRIAEADGGGFGVMKRFCQSVDTRHLVVTSEYDGLGVSVKIPLYHEENDRNKLEFHSGELPESRTDNRWFSPSSLLIYKLKDAVISLN